VTDPKASPGAPPRRPREHRNGAAARRAGALRCGLAVPRLWRRRRSHGARRRHRPRRIRARSHRAATAAYGEPSDDERRMNEAPTTCDRRRRHPAPTAPRRRMPTPRPASSRRGCSSGARV